MATSESPLRAWRDREAKRRKGRTFTQEEAAQALGVSQGTYSDWETMKKSPRPSGLLKIHGATGIPLTKLIIAFAQAKAAA